MKGGTLRTGTGVVLCLFALALPIFPDERLVRLKLLSFETSIFILLLIAGVYVLSRRGIRLSPLTGLVLAWAGWNILLYFISNESALARAELRRVFLALGAFAAVRFGPIPTAWRRRFWSAWTAAAGIVALYGILQYVGGIGPILVPKMDRVMGTFGNPIFFAGYLVFSVFIGLFEARPRGLAWFSVPLQLAALFLTQTRAAWVAFFVGLLAVAFFRTGGWKRSPWMLGGLIALLFGFIVATQDTWKRDQGHLLIWRDTARMIRDRPLTGVGLGAFHVAFPEYAGEDLKSKWPQGRFIVNDAHNEYLQSAAEGGIPLFLLFLSLTAAFVVLGFKKGMMGPWLAGSALLVQNIFSVDMRFGIDFALFFIAAAFVDKPDDDPPGGPMTLPRGAAAGVFLVAMGGLVLPAMLKPYRAQRTVANQVGFFDARLLEANRTIRDVERLAERYPSEPDVWERLAYLYAKEMKSPDGKINVPRARQAEAAYRKLIAMDPNRLAARNNFANVLYTMGRVDDAIRQWETAVSIDPSFLDGHLNLGKIYYSQGKLKKSADHLQRALKIDPNNAEAVVYLKKMVE